MTDDARYYYVTWEKGMWMDRIPHSFFSQDPGPVEHLYLESEVGESAQAQAVLSRSGSTISLSYEEHPDWWEGTLRLWLLDGEPQVEWRDRDGNLESFQPKVSRDPPWKPTGPEKTRKTLRDRKVDVRPEQSAFRNRALRVYSRACAVTRLACVDALEAAHIWTYEKHRDNTDGNCLLLRRDLHILFDRNLIGLAPDGRVHFATKELEAHYHAPEAPPVTWKAGSPAPYPEAIRKRWEEFQDRLKKQHKGVKS